MCPSFENALIQAACDTPSIGNLFRTVPSLDPALRGYTLRSVCVLRHKQGKRCLIKYQGLLHDQVPFDLLGKMRFKSPDARTPRLQSTLRNCGFDGSQGFSVPPVYGELTGLNMWLQGFEQSATPLAISRATEFIAAQCNVAQLLARLHRCPVRVSSVHSVSDEMKLLADRFSRLRQSHFDLVTMIDSLEAASLQIVQALQEESKCTLIHRDFYFDQVLSSPTQTVLVDLDLCCMGPPELDVGNYTGHLREYALRFPGSAAVCRDAERVFLDCYFQQMRNANHEAVELWANLTLARHVYLSTVLPGRSKTTFPLAEQVFRCAENCTSFTGL